MRNAIVLAAGEGSKIWPYNETRQKCALPVANVPIVRRLVEQLQRIGIQRIAVVVGALGGTVRAVLDDLPSVRLVEQPRREGTAPAALLAWALFPDEPTLVLYGDIVLSEADLRRFVEISQQEAPLAAALLAPCGEEKPQNCLIGHREGEVLRGVEGHPRGGQERLCGVYAFQPQARRFLENNPGIFRSVPVGGMPPLEAEIAASLQRMIEAGETVRAVLAQGFFVDVDKPWHLLGATHRVLDDLFDHLEESRIAPSARIHDGAEIHGKVVLGEGSLIGNRVVVKGDLWVGAHTQITNGAMIGGRTVIGSHARVREYCLIGGHCALGDRTLCGHGAELDGILFDRAYLYHYCEMAGVFGSAVDIGAATVCGTLRFDDGETVFTIKGRRETPPYGANCAYMGDYSRTGVNAILMPGVRVGAYSCVGPGVILYEDLPSRKMILAKQEYVLKDWGPEKYGW